MNSVKVNRRKFLKMLGWGGAGTALAGCDLPTTVTLEEGKEEVVAYVLPEEYVIPGIGVWYASTCIQCAAGCGLHGRVREGRVLKVEGHPDSPINHGKTCMMGQAGVQAHYNPDRITSPMMRKAGRMQAVSWDEALAEINKKIGADSDLKGERFAWFTGSVSGHQAVLVSDLAKQLGAGDHYAHEMIHSTVWQSVCQEMLGDSMPRLRFDKAQVVLSFGADFLGTWVSPVHFSGEYAKFRSGDRGVLIQVEPKMTLTGGNADLWMPAKPGTEGVLAYGLANFIIDRGWNKVHVPDVIRQSLAQYNVDAVSEITEIPVSKIKRIASFLTERAPSLILAGASTEGHENGFDAVSAVMLLNIIMGNIGETIEPGNHFPEASLHAKPGNTKSVIDFAKAVSEKAYDVVFFYGSNPVFTAPKTLGLSDSLETVPFKVAFAQFPDETTMKADVILPIFSNMEDWGSHVAAYQANETIISLQQPLMEPLYKETRGFGDVILSLLQMRDKEYGNFKDYYAYLVAAMTNMPGADVADTPRAKQDYWENVLQHGQVKVSPMQNKLRPKMLVANLKASSDTGEYSMHLAPSARLGLWDGRHANLPWLQEAPDQISKVVWGSWAELHPSTAGKLGVKNGDYVMISSENGSIETQVYVHKGIRQDVVSVPMGQGHEEYGRYAKNRGVSPFTILSAKTEQKTGELALYATKVKVAKVRKSEVLVKMGGSETQLGRKLVQTVSADSLRRSEGEV